MRCFRKQRKSAQITRSLNTLIGPSPKLDTVHRATGGNSLGGSGGGGGVFFFFWGGVVCFSCSRECLVFVRPLIPRLRFFFFLSGD